MLYPPNWLHLLLPLGMAINWIIALHVFLAGYFMHLWCRSRGCSPPASLLAGIMSMFSGFYFLHIYAGHLPHVAVMVWVPLLLLSIDALARGGSLRWCLVGIFAVAMHVLAGHPQYVYYTGLCMGVYLLLNLSHSPHRAKLLLGFILIYVGGAMVAAVQLLSGIDAVGEWVRAGGIPYVMAKTLCLYPHNLITLLAPVSWEASNAWNCLNKPSRVSTTARDIFGNCAFLSALPACFSRSTDCSALKAGFAGSLSRCSC